MRIIKMILLAAWLTCSAFLVAYSVVSSTAGERPPDAGRVYGVAGGVWGFITGLYIMAVNATGMTRADALGGLLVGLPFGAGFFALGVAALSLGGILPDGFRIGASIVVVAWFALMAVLVFATLRSNRAVLARSAHTSHEAQVELDRLRGSDQGMTTQQVALLLMLAGAITTVVALKFLVFGPPPYSRLAYVIGPVLLAVGYLMDRHALRDVLREVRKPAAAPTAGGGVGDDAA
ncbi:hypothetical protein J0H58_12310 [bacterium]|nr:hypothetical protein [bacterium]